MEVINGIKCELTSKEAIEALRFVLARIREIAEDDLCFLQKYVRTIRPMPDPGPGDLKTSEPKIVELGEVVPYLPSSFEELRNNPDSESQVDILVAEQQESQLLPYTIAHELGHVATTEIQMDRIRRELVDDGEWASEMLADLYMLKWIDVDIDFVQKSRYRLHHRVSLQDTKQWLEIVSGPRTDDE